MPTGDVVGRQCGCRAIIGRSDLHHPPVTNCDQKLSVVLVGVAQAARIDGSRMT